MKLLFAALSVVASAAVAAKVEPHLSLTRGLNDGNAFGEVQTGTYECLVLEEHSLKLPDAAGDIVAHGDEPWYCETDDGQLYEINKPAAWFKARGVVSGETVMVVTNADKVNGRFDAPPKLKLKTNSKVEVVKNDRRRRLAPKTGKSSMLVIRGVAADGAPSKSADQLADDVFGELVGGSDPVNLASQFDACSGGVLTYTPATGTGISKGVVEIAITESINGMNRITAHNLFTDAASLVVGSLSQWTQVFLVMQDGVDFQGAAAYAYINSWLSVYSNIYGSQVVVQMHEIGHNLGLYHSGEVQAYDDHTCMMGNPFYADDASIQCFNGAKSAFLGWYSDRVSTVTPQNNAWSGQLVGVDDYVKDLTTNDHTVVAKVDDSSSPEDLYIMYNRRKGVNSGVVEYMDKVTVVRAENTASSSFQSYIVAALSATQTYRAPNFSGSGFDLVVEVCSLVNGPPDTARVLVYLDGFNNVSCDDSTPAPTAAVSPAPTPRAVTSAPTIRTGTPAPTQKDTTAQPTATPTVAAPTTSSPTEAPVCPVCGNGDVCCTGVCETSGNPQNRKCITTSSCPVCGNGDECCDGACSLEGPKWSRQCITTGGGGGNDCPVCGNGDSCCDGVCASSGPKKSRACLVGAWSQSSFDSLSSSSSTTWKWTGSATMVLGALAAALLMV